LFKYNNKFNREISVDSSIPGIKCDRNDEGRYSFTAHIKIATLTTDMDSGRGVMIRRNCAKLVQNVHHFHFLHPMDTKEEMERMTSIKFILCRKIYDVYIQNQEVIEYESGVVLRNLNKDNDMQTLDSNNEEQDNAGMSLTLIQPQSQGNAQTMSKRSDYDDPVKVFDLTTKICLCEIKKPKPSFVIGTQMNMHNWSKHISANIHRAWVDRVMRQSIRSVSFTQVTQDPFIYASEVGINGIQSHHNLFSIECIDRSE
jgi:hypothetical protein